MSITAEDNTTVTVTFPEVSSIEGLQRAYKSYEQMINDFVFEEGTFMLSPNIYEIKYTVS